MTARRRFGATWWGRAWVEALEQRARLDPNRLPRGRTYARQARVASLTVAPGEVTANVYGSQPQPYRVRVRVRMFDDDQWRAVIDAIAAKAAHAAALLDGELDPGVADDAAEAGADLLPAAGDVTTSCSCPDWANPCKHAAAVCYLLADALDHEPFDLLLLRGRDRETVLLGLRDRRQSSSERTIEPEDEHAIIDAATAFAAGREPVPPAPRRHPTGRTVTPIWPADPPPGAPFTGDGLRLLVADAARRATALLDGDKPAWLSLDERADQARIAAGALDTPALGPLARRFGRPVWQVVAWGRAWQLAGQDGLAASNESSWRPPPRTMAAAAAAVEAVTGRLPTATGNRLKLDAECQLRLSRDGRWYRFVRTGARWALDSAGAVDPDDLVDAPATRSSAV